MQTYTKVYLKTHGYSVIDFIPCLNCGAKAVDIHHINGRIGKLKDDPTNLVALCRDCHNKAHVNKLTKEYLKSLI